MNKVTRLDSRRDAEAIELAQELRETEAWFHGERFRHITRLHTPYEVVALRGGLIDRALCALIRGEIAPGTGEQCNSWLRSKVDVERAWLIGIHLPATRKKWRPIERLSKNNELDIETQIDRNHPIGVKERRALCQDPESSRGRTRPTSALRL